MNTTRSSTNTAILMMFIGIMNLSINDALAKVLMEHYSPIQILFIRTLIALPFAAFLAFYTGGVEAFRSHRPSVHILRSVLWIAATILFFTSVKHLDLSLATALIFVAPLFIAIISVVFFGEHVSKGKWLAIFAGFIGMLVIVRPGMIAFNVFTLLPIATALLYALLMSGARMIDKRESVWTQLFYLTGLSAVLSAMVVPFVWEGIRAEDILLFLGITLFGISGMTLITQAFRLAPAATIAPLEYTSLIWATLLGWIFWGESLAFLTFVGAAIIVASGIYIIRVDRKAG